MRTIILITVAAIGVIIAQIATLATLGSFFKRLEGINDQACLVCDRQQCECGEQP